MKVLIGNFHNSNFGGGEFYTYQVAKAISGFAQVYFVQQPNQNIWASNPSLKIPFRLWNSTQEVDAYLNFNHFRPYVCNTSKRNVAVVFFPNKEHRVADYNDIVSICPYSNGYVKEYWGKEGKICLPYSKDYPANSTKTPKTLLSIGNFFQEADGHSKNQHILIDAFKKLGKGWKLTLIGNVVSETYLKTLQEAAKGFEVQVLPNAPESVKDALLASSEFYWHGNGYGRTDPYQTEHFGIAPEEALKSGCLTYVHNSGGAKDFCKSWNSVSELVKMTKAREPNKPNLSFQTPQAMADFWESLCTGN